MAEARRAPEDRYTTEEVLAKLGGISRVTLWRRIKAGAFPRALKGEKGKWRVSDVDAAMRGGVDEPANETDDGWEIDADALADDLAAAARHRAAKKERYIPRLIRGKARSAPRLAVDNTAAENRPPHR